MSFVRLEAIMIGLQKVLEQGITVKHSLWDAKYGNAQSLKIKPLKILQYETDLPPEPEFVRGGTGTVFAGSQRGGVSSDKSLYGYDILQCNLALVQDAALTAMIHWTPSNDYYTESQQNAINQINKENRNGVLFIGSSSGEATAMQHEEYLRDCEDVNVKGVFELPTGVDEYWTLTYRPKDDLGIVLAERERTLFYFNVFQNVQSLI